jgi:GTPase SAR1 family protein
MNDISDNKKIKIKIGVIGDQGVGKSFLINLFLSSNKDSSVETSMSFFYLAPMCKRIQKTIQSKKFILEFYQFSSKNDKIIAYIQSCQVVLIVIDLNNRNSFENLSDYWLGFLKNDCYYENDIYVLGNYLNVANTPLTSGEEVNEMLKLSQIDTTYIEIGKNTQEESVGLLDKLIHDTHLGEIKRSKTNDCNKGGSLKVDKCFIY